MPIPELKFQQVMIIYPFIFIANFITNKIRIKFIVSKNIAAIIMNVILNDTKPKTSKGENW